jgi:hypothetical protein
MATMAEVREGEYAGLALDQAEVLGERSASDFGRRCVPSPRLSVERLCEVIGKGHGGAPHNRIIASHAAWGSWTAVEPRDALRASVVVSSPASTGVKTSARKRRKAVRIESGLAPFRRRFWFLCELRLQMNRCSRQAEGVWCCTAVLLCSDADAIWPHTSHEGSSAGRGAGPSGAPCRA